MNREEFRQLPNRDSFAGFYYDSKASNYAKASNYRRKLSKNELKLMAKVAHYYIVLGILIPLPFLAGKLIYDYSIQALHIGNTAITQPVVYFLFVILINLSILIYKKVFDMIAHVGYRPVLFSMYILICLLLIAPFLFLICNSFGSFALRELSFYFVATIISVTLSKILFIPITNKPVRITKDSILIFVFVICLLIGLLYLFSSAFKLM